MHPSRRPVLPLQLMAVLHAVAVTLVTGNSGGGISYISSVYNSPDPTSHLQLDNAVLITKGHTFIKPISFQHNYQDARAVDFITEFSK